MPRSQPSDITARLERITALARDLSRELLRTHGEAPAVSTIAEQIRNDAEAVLSKLKRRKR
jgi:hypothetical protein